MSRVGVIVAVTNRGLAETRRKIALVIAVRGGHPGAPEAVKVMAWHHSSQRWGKRPEWIKRGAWYLAPLDWPQTKAAIDARNADPALRRLGAA